MMHRPKEEPPDQDLWHSILDVGGDSNDSFDQFMAADLCNEAADNTNTNTPWPPDADLDLDNLDLTDALVMDPFAAPDDSLDCWNPSLDDFVATDLPKSQDDWSTFDRWNCDGFGYQNFHLSPLPPAQSDFQEGRRNDMAMIQEAGEGTSDPMWRYGEEAFQVENNGGKEKNVTNSILMPCYYDDDDPNHLINSIPSHHNATTNTLHSALPVRSTSALPPPPPQNAHSATSSSSSSSSQYSGADFHCAENLNNGMAVPLPRQCGSIANGPDDGENNVGRRRRHLLPHTDRNTEITFSELTKYFHMPITQAARELKVGLTVLKKRCREFGIPRWPHRKMKSLESLIHNIQELGKSNGGLSQSRLANAVEILEEQKRLMEAMPGVELAERTKRLRQACFKANYKKRRQMASCSSSIREDAATPSAASGGAPRPYPYSSSSSVNSS